MLEFAQVLAKCGADNQRSSAHEYSRLQKNLIGDQVLGSRDVVGVPTFADRSERANTMGSERIRCVVGEDTDRTDEKPRHSEANCHNYAL